MALLLMFGCAALLMKRWRSIMGIAAQLISVCGVAAADHGSERVSNTTFPALHGTRRAAHDDDDDEAALYWTVPRRLGWTGGGATPIGVRHPSQTTQGRRRRGGRTQRRIDLLQSVVEKNEYDCPKTLLSILLTVIGSETDVVQSSIHPVTTRTPLLDRPPSWR
jgi:hypothetical protein